MIAYLRWQWFLFQSRVNVVALLVPIANECLRAVTAFLCSASPPKLLKFLLIMCMSPNLSQTCKIQQKLHLAIIKECSEIDEDLAFFSLKIACI